MTGQYYLRARYYNLVIARFTQEDTYYGDGLNLYTYCQNNPILYHDPTGHGTKENSPYSRNEQQYIDAGADPDTARLAAQCYPDAKSKQDLYNKYKKQGYSAQDAKKLANREIIHGEEATKKYIKDNNVKKSGPDYTATSPRDNVNTDWRTQERLNAQRNASNSRLMPMNLQFFAAKRDEGGNKSGSKTVPNPNGKKGGVAHQSVIDDIKTDAEKRGLTYDTEYKYDTTGGYKNSRYADVVVYDSKGRVMEIHQVGRTTKRTGAPVSRERKAIRDIRSSVEYNGAKIIYHPYDR